MIVKYITRRILKALHKKKNIDSLKTISSSIKFRTTSQEYLYNHQLKGVEYLNARGRNFGSQFAYVHKKPFNTSGLRLAICMSGYMRTYEKTAHSFVKNVLEPLNADLFIYTPNKSGVSWEVAKNANHQLISDEDRNSQEVTIEKLYQHYPADKIKKYNIWEYDETLFDCEYLSDVQKTWDGRDGRRVLSFFYHIEKCNELKKKYEEENNFKYDVVIRLRGDLAFLQPFNLENVIKDPKFSNTIYYNAFNHISAFGKRYIDSAFILPFYNIEKGVYIPSGEHYFNDFITIGNAHNMDKACAVYSHARKYLMEDKIGSNPETLFWYHIINNKLDVAMEDITTCQLFRENYKTVFNEFMYKNGAQCALTRDVDCVYNANTIYK